MQYRKLSNLARTIGAPHFVRGQVVTDQGEIPWEWVDITMRCGGGFLKKAFADNGGNFIFDARSDPEYRKREARGIGAGGYGYFRSRPLYGTGSISCSLQVHSPGYRSAQLELPDIRRMGRIEVGTLELRRLEGVTGSVASHLSPGAPPVASSAYKKGLQALRRAKPDYERVSVHLEKAVQTDPRFSAAWTALGEARSGIGDLDGAREAFLRAIDVDPDFLPPYEPLMDLALLRMDWLELNSLSKRYLALSPNSIKGLYLRGVAAVNTQDFSLAEQMALRLTAQDEDDAEVKSRFVMAMVHEGRSEFVEAAELYEAIVGSVDRRIHEWIENKLRKWKSEKVLGPRPAAPQSQIDPP